MKRDMDLVRLILLTMEEDPHGFVLKPLTIEGYEQEVIAHHVWLIHDGALVTADIMTTTFSDSPVADPSTITWKGHEFLDAVRSDTVWQKMKAQLKDKGMSLPFSVL